MNNTNGEIGHFGGLAKKLGHYNVTACPLGVGQSGTQI